MVCSNCQSTKVLAVQDQFFCINCGQLVLEEDKPVSAAGVSMQDNGLPSGVKILPVDDTDPVAVVASLVPTAKAAVTTLPPEVSVAPPMPKRRKPGRPKAGRLDIPKAPAVTQPATATPPAAPRLTDLAAVKAKTKAATSQTELPELHIAKPPRPARISYAQTAVTSLTGRTRPSELGWSLIPASFIALLVGGATLALLDGRGPSVVEATRRGGLAVWGELGLVLGLYYFSRSIVGSALVYGAARRADHRAAPISRWFNIAVNSLGVRTRFDAMTSILQLMVTLLLIALLMQGGVVWPVPVSAQIAGLFVAFLGLLYLHAGLSLTQGLGRVSLTLSNASATQAFALGWTFFRRHIELIGFRFVSLGLEAILLIPFAAATVAIATLLPPQSAWLAAAGTALLACLAGALIGAGMAAWWQDLYRRLVHHDRKTEALTLLSSRHSERPHNAALITTAIVSTLLIIMAIIWPWLPFVEYQL